MSIVGHRIPQLIAHHGVAVLLIILVGRKVAVNLLECVSSIIVVCIDDCKRPVDLVDSAQDRMCRPPWFCTALRYGKALRDVLDPLKRIGSLHILLHPASDGLAEVLFIFLLDDKHHFLKARQLRIIYGKLHDDVSLIVHRVDLLQPAVAASHSRSHDH